jgi:hypothetical protein
VAAPKDNTAILVLGLLGLGAALALSSRSSTDDTGDGWGPSSTPTYDVDFRDKASTVRYKDTGGYGSAAGEVKRTYSSRALSKIKGITIHHVGVSQVGEGAIHKFTYHVVVHHDGTVYWLHPWSVRLLHGGLLNTSTIGIGISGSFGDVETEMPPEQAAGLRKAIAWVVQDANAQGAQIGKVWTHRQASANRGLDPGRSPYREGVLWAANTLGLDHDPNETRGSGLTIPDKWLTQTASAELPDPGLIGPRALTWQVAEGDFVDAEGDDELAVASV